MSFTYDPLGRHISKTHTAINGAITQTDFYWNGDVLLSETTTKRNIEQPKENKASHPKAAQTTLYLFEPGTFKPLALIKNDKVYSYHLDHLGTPEALTDEHGEYVWYGSFTSYGNLAVNYDIPEARRIDQPLRFQGQYCDTETGLHYNRHRYYDPQVGSFITPDPVGLIGGTNSYRYTPNPIQWVDPYGLTAIKEDFSRQFNTIAKAKPDYYMRLESTLPDTEAMSPLLRTNIASPLDELSNSLKDFSQGGERNGSFWAESDFGDLKKVYEPDPIVLKNNKSAHSFANSVTEGGTGRAFAGHGTLFTQDGTFTIPKGTALTLPRNNIKITDRTGQYIERGDWIGLAHAASKNKRTALDIKGMTSWLEGSEVPNYTLSLPNDLHIFSKSISTRAETLKNLIEPDMGCVNWAACTYNFD